MLSQPNRRQSELVLDQAGFEAVVEAHEQFLKGRGGARAVLKFASLAGVFGQRRLLNDVELAGANLSGAHLAGAHFERASLQGADLSLADLRSANLRRADLRGAKLTGACLNGAVLDEADLRAARLVRVGVGQWGEPDAADGYGADLSHCAMRGVRLCAANLKGVNFTGAVLEGVNFTGANATGAIFDGAVITGAVGAGSALTAEQLSACTPDPAAKAVARKPHLLALIEAVGSWVESNGAQGAPGRLDSEDLRPLAGLLRGRPLTALSVRGVCAVGVDFSNCQLQGSDFRGADLRGAIFEGADLRGARFDDARLGHARFVGADLGLLHLLDGRRIAASFTGASLDRADFSATNMVSPRT
jgi:uncharacterized protein YjbI with pentapeptide repeats